MSLPARFALETLAPNFSSGLILPWLKCDSTCCGRSGASRERQPRRWCVASPSVAFRLKPALFRLQAFWASQPRNHLLVVQHKPSRVYSCCCLQCECDHTVVQLASHCSFSLSWVQSCVSASSSRWVCVDGCELPLAHELQNFSHVFPMLGSLFVGISLDSRSWVPSRPPGICTFRSAPKTRCFQGLRAFLHFVNGCEIVSKMRLNSTNPFSS